jgi:hypothetical protein
VYCLSNTRVMEGQKDLHLKKALPKPLLQLMMF